MLNRFLNGLVFGFGASIAFVVVWLIASPYIVKEKMAAPRPSDPGRDTVAVVRQAPPLAQQPASAPQRPDVVRPATIEEQYAADPQHWLELADAYKAQGLNTSTDNAGRYLVGPAGENAVELYRKVLSLQPDNARARQGLRDVAAFYKVFAQKACGKEIYDACARTAEDGLQADPDDAELKALLVKAEASERAATTQR